MLRPLLIPLFLAVFLFSVNAQAGRLQDGAAAYRRHDYQAALNLLQPLADQGDAGAQEMLGDIYEYGRNNGGKGNWKEAFKWYLKAAKHGNVRAQNIVGEAYWRGDRIKQDYTEALKWWRKAAAQGNMDAQNRIGGIYAAGKGVKKDDAEAMKWYRMAADQGHFWAEENISRAYEEGLGVPKNYEEACYWHWRADSSSAPLAISDTVCGQINLVKRYSVYNRVKEWRKAHRSPATDSTKLQ